MAAAQSLTAAAAYVLCLFMADRNDIDDRRMRRLRELAELGMAEARSVQKRMAGATASEMVALAAEFERAARTVRDAVAAEAMLERRRRAQRLARERVRSPRPPVPEPASRTVH